MATEPLTLNKIYQKLEPVNGEINVQNITQDAYIEIFISATDEIPDSSSEGRRFPYLSSFEYIENGEFVFGKGSRDGVRGVRD